MLGFEFTAWPVAPAPESTNLPSDPEPESDSDAVGCPAGNGTLPAESTRSAGITDASNVTPIRRRRARRPSDQLSLFQTAHPAAEGP
jgi:hypothetical protein